MSRTTDSKKQIILDFINEYYGSYGETPTVRDIAAGTGIAVTSVHRYLSAMKEDGELEYNGRRSVSTRRMEMEQVAHAMPVLGYGYKGRVSGKIAKYFDEKITLADCKPRLIHGFYDYQREDGDSEQTILHYHNLLHTAFEYAIRQEILEYNPMDRVERPQPKKFVGDFYSVDEVKTLLEHAKEDVIYIPIVLAVYCGLRRSEALGLSWSNINFENDKIFIGQKVLEVVRNGKMEQVVSDEMKTESSRRSFKMIPEVKEILLAHKERQELYRKQFRRAYCKKYLDMVCVNPLGELIKPSYITSHFPKLLKQYGMRDIRFHDLRHTCASLLVSLDVNMKVIQKYLGHSNMSTTADIYSHLDANATGEAGMKLGKLLSDDESEMS